MSTSESSQFVKKGEFMLHDLLTEKPNRAAQSAAQLANGNMDVQSYDIERYGQTIAAIAKESGFGAAVEAAIPLARKIREHGVPSDGMHIGSSLGYIPIDPAAANLRDAYNQDELGKLNVADAVTAHNAEGRPGSIKVPDRDILRTAEGIAAMFSEVHLGQDDDRIDAVESEAGAFITQAMDEFANTLNTGQGSSVSRGGR